MTALTIAIGGDHAGLPLKSVLQQALAEAGHALVDFGTNSTESVDYPDFAHAVSAAVEAGKASFGVLVCGTGIGVQIAANRHAGIRAAVLHNTTEARLTRAHNDANVACFGARMCGPEVALDALRVFLATEFEGGRHARRLTKLSPSDQG
jgi:ribose 5-phosphate isomerase B